MKIIDIVLCHKRAEAVKDIVKKDYCMYLFRSPVIFSINGTEKVYSGSTAIIYKSGSKQSFRGTAGKGLKYDMVSFRMLSSERQYITDIFDTPIKLHDDFMMSSAIKSMKIYLDMYGHRKEEYCELYMKAVFIGLEQDYRLVKSEKNSILKYPALQSRAIIYMTIP